jgi:hypothetical protein
MAEIEVNNTRNIFRHNYPTSSLIQASRHIHGKVYHRSYDIISLGHYPQNICFTKKSKTGIKYKIPNKYIVKTNQFGYDIVCETNYQKGRVIFQITWTNKDGVERIVKSIKSATDAANLLIKVRLFAYYNCYFAFFN